MNKLVISSALILAFFTVVQTGSAQAGPPPTTGSSTPTITVISPRLQNIVIPRGGVVSMQGIEAYRGSVSVLVDLRNYTGNDSSLKLFVSKSTNPDQQGYQLETYTLASKNIHLLTPTLFDRNSLPAGEYFLHAVLTYGNSQTTKARSPFSFKIVDTPSTLDAVTFADLQAPNLSPGKIYGLNSWSTNQPMKIGWTMTYADKQEIGSQAKVNITACGRKFITNSDQCYSLKTGIPNTGLANDVVLPSGLSGSDYVYIFVRVNLPNNQFIQAQSLPFRLIGGSVAETSSTNQNTQLASVVSALQSILESLSSYTQGR